MDQGLLGASFSLECDNHLSYYLRVRYYITGEDTDTFYFAL